MLYSNLRQPTLHSFIKDSSRPARKRTRLSYDVATKIPLQILVNHVLPFLDRSTWNSLTIVSKDIFRASRRQIPPWPERLIISNRPIKSTAVSPIAFDPTGVRLAVLANDDSINIYDARRGHIKALDLDNIESIIIDRIYLLDSKTIMLLSSRGAIYWQLDDRMNVIDVYDEGIDGIDVYNFSHGPLLEADTCRGWTKNDQNFYLATTTTHDPNNTGTPIRIQNLNRNKKEEDSSVCWIHYPVFGAEIKCLQFLTLSSGGGLSTCSNRRILVSISKERDVHVWRFDQTSDIRHDKKSISLGKIPIHCTDDTWTHRYIINTIPNKGEKLRITEIIERWCYDDDSTNEEKGNGTCNDDDGTEDDDDECSCDCNFYCGCNDDDDDDDDDGGEDHHDDHTENTFDMSYIERQVIIWEQTIDDDEDDKFQMKHDFRTRRRDVNSVVSDDGRFLVSLTKDWNLDVRQLNEREKDEDEYEGDRPKLMRTIKGCYHFDGCRPDNSYSFRYDPRIEMSWLSSDVGVYLSRDCKVAVTSSQRELRIHHL
jgi:hypothetical protein